MVSQILVKHIEKTDAIISMHRTISAYDNRELYVTWRQLTDHDYNPNAFWDEKNLITLEEWQKALYSELCRRGLAGH